MKDEQYMQLAIDLVKNTISQTAPNPAVGCVVVKDGTIVGFGAHLKAGEGHAEVLALQMAGEKAKGATAYVTLEPCAHYGKTPPCAKLLIEKEIARVVVSAVDKNPLVAGKGIQLLKDAGIEVEVGLLKEQTEKLLQPFFSSIETKQPYVILKTGMSLDGKMKTEGGESKWITNEASRKDVHIEREKCDGIIVGIGTVLADNPKLNVRHAKETKQPRRIVLDTNLQTPEHFEVAKDSDSTIFISGINANKEKVEKLRQLGNEVWLLEEEELTLKNILKRLYKSGVAKLYVEGGNRLHSSFIKEGLFNEIHAYVAPKLIGGSQSFFSNEQFTTMKEVPVFTLESVTQFGDDVKLVYKRG